ncbi:MAG: hypothetical protein AB7Q97_26000 [Gammaproteobacteria bacterium]
MATRYKERIETYCTQRGIAIPPGFRRHPASRYAAIDMGAQPPRLIATTWFKIEDLAYYVLHSGAGRTLKLLDFKDDIELRMDAGGRLERVGPA